MSIPVFQDVLEYVSFIHKSRYFDMSLNSTQLEAIQLFINDKISPGVQAHGGDVVIESFENNILTLTLQGACGSCGAYCTACGSWVLRGG